MYNIQYQYTHDIDWFFLVGNLPVHCASNGGRVPNIYRAIDLQNIQVAVEAIQPSCKYVLNKAALERYVHDHYRNISEDTLSKQWLSEVVRDVEYDEDIPIWMKAYSWSFVKMARRGFLSFDRDADTGLYFLVARPAGNTEVQGDVERLMYRLPVRESPFDNNQNLKQDYLEQINFVSTIERYERDERKHRL